MTELLLPADAAPGEAAVGPQIARFSGRTFTPVQDLLPAGELAALRDEASRVGSAAILDRAVTELLELGEISRAPGSAAPGSRGPHSPGAGS